MLSSLILYAWILIVVLAPLAIGGSYIVERYGGSNRR